MCEVYTIGIYIYIYNNHNNACHYSNKTVDISNLYFDILIL